MEIVDINPNADNYSVDSVVEWIRTHHGNGALHKMIVIIEDKDERVFSRNINVLNRDYLFMLQTEIHNMMDGE